MRITSTVSKIVIEWEQDLFEVSPRSLTALKNVLSSVKEIQSVQLSGVRQKRIVVVYQSPQGVVEFLRHVTQTIRSAQVDDEIYQLEKIRSAEPIKQPDSYLRRLSQGFYGFLACGSFVMAWVGLIVPGIPTVPFVILTVYFGEKVSPTFRKALMDSPVIGSCIRDWAEHRAIRRSVKNQAYFLLSAMILMALLMTPIDSIQFISMILVAGLSIYIINRIPLLEDLLPDHQPGLLVA